VLSLAASTPTISSTIWAVLSDDLRGPSIEIGRISGQYDGLRWAAKPVFGSSSSPIAVHKWLKDAKKAGIL
jgi:hypothetical protein